MIERLIHQLRAEQVEPDPYHLADALWLLLQWKRAAASGFAKGASGVDKSLPPKEPRDRGDEGSSIHDTDDQTDVAQDAPEISSAALHPRLPTLRTDNGVGTPFRSPTGAALPDALNIGRAFRPLLRRVPSRARQQLDIDATVRRIAESGGRIWIPAFHPERERWFDLALIVDSNLSMIVWSQTVAELRKLLEYSGAFRSVQAWHLMTDKASGAELTVLGGTGTHSPAEIIDPSGRRIVLIVSDCVGSAWWSGSTIQLIKLWTTSMPTVLIQVLPERLWQGTALGNYLPITVKSLNRGSPNTQLNITLPNLWDTIPQGAVPLPVATLDPTSVRSAVRMIVGAAHSSSSGVLLSDFIIPNEDLSPQPVSEAASPEGLLASFRATASPLAQRLAAYLAAVPLTLPVMRLVQHTMLPTSRQMHLAEVFLSGLLRQVKTTEKIINPEHIQYEWTDPQLAELLLDSLAVPEAITTLRVVIDEVRSRISQLVEWQTGQVLDFEALIADPDASIGVALDVALEPFAYASARLLRRLGGRYAQAAARLETVYRSSASQPARKVRRVQSHGSEENKAGNSLLSSNIFSRQKPPIDNLVACYRCSTMINEEEEQCVNCQAIQLLKRSEKKYRIQGILGRGGFGQVYDAVDLGLLNRRCAIKHIVEELPINAKHIEMEVRVLSAQAARLSSAPDIYDYWQSGKDHYIVMQYIEGEQLDKMHKLPWPPSSVVDFLKSMLVQLQSMHQSGIIHRDIKPSNIKYSSERGYVLLDFGLSRLDREEVIQAATPEYAPPEQMSRRASSYSTDTRSDLYSLAATSYYLLFGRPPLTRMRGEPITFPETKQQLPSQLLLFLESMLEHDPDQRPRSAQEALALLQSINVDELPTEALDPRFLEYPTRSDKNRSVVSQTRVEETQFNDEQAHSEDLSDEAVPLSPVTSNTQPTIEPVREKVHETEAFGVAQTHAAPFSVGGPIRDPRLFFGREREVRRIISLFKRTPFGNAAIIGPRRSGKTSLLLHLQRIGTTLINQQESEGRDTGDSTHDRYRWVYIDFQDARMGNKEKLLSKVLQELDLPVERPCTLEMFLDIIETKLTDAVIILFDEVEVALKRYPELDDAFWESLRSLPILVKSGRIGFILASHEAPFKTAMENQVGSPFFNIFAYTVNLGPLTKDEAYMFIQASPVPFSEDDVNWILTESGRWPILLQIFCRECLAAIEDGRQTSSWRAEALVQAQPFVHLLD